MYLLRLALRPWRMAPWSQVFSALAVGFLLLLAGFLFWMQDGLRTVVVHLKGEQVITAYLQPSIEPDAVGRVLEDVRGVFGADAGVAVQLVDRAEFLTGLKGSYPELVRDLEDLGQQVSQVVPRYVSVSGVFASSKLDAVRKVSGIESAEASGDRYRPIVGAFSALRWIARVIMVGICFALFTGLIHLSRLNGYLQRDALGILRLWGASSISLLAPGLISGLLVGALGGVLATSGWLSLGAALGRQVRSLSPILNHLPAFSAQMSWVLFLIGGISGLMAGVFGSLSGIQLDRQEGGQG